MKVVIFNLGCKVNQYECDVIADKLLQRGCDVSLKLEFADTYILNTCAVTKEAERKSRQAVSRCLAFNPNGKIYVIGCASENNAQNFKKNGVHYIAGVANKFSVVEQILSNEYENLDIIENVNDLPTEYEYGKLSSPHHTRELIKIQDGCNNFCSYCIIPFVRGRSRSRTIEDIVDEVELLSTKTKEIVLTGIDIMAFGKDNNTSLTKLISELKSFDIRIRLGSIYAEKIDEELLDTLFSLKRFCPQFHLSLQSGDNDVLHDMNRHYTAEEYLNKIELIRKYDNFAAITTDIIVGFPTETEKAFQNTVDFVGDANFSDLHVFPYSSRPGTRASKLKCLPSEIVKERKLYLLKEKEKLHTQFLEKNLGHKHEVLLEEFHDGFSEGYSRNYIRIYTQKKGDIVEVVPNKIEKDGLKEI